MLQLVSLALLAAPQLDVPATPRGDVVIHVDASGQGDFTRLVDAIAAAPDGALLLVAPGAYDGATISARSLKIQAESPADAEVTSRLYVDSIGATQEVHIGGLRFIEGFEVRDSAGEVDFSACSTLNDGITVDPPPGVHFTNYPDCGIGLSRQTIVNSDAVTLVDCVFEGRDGTRFAVCDGSPGEHGVLAIDSRVTIYGGTLVGGDGSDAPGCHGAYAGAGGDGVLGRGADTRVILCDVAATGGTGGLDLELNWSHGCQGIASRAQDGALVESCPADHVTFEIVPAAAAGTAPSYTITGPAGADVWLMFSRSRGWREFPSDAGVLHMGGPFQFVSLGTLPASGSLTRPFPAPRPAWLGAYANVEIQAYALVNGADRYSEPRTLRVLHGGI